MISLRKKSRILLFADTDIIERIAFVQEYQLSLTSLLCTHNRRQPYISV